MEPKKNPEVDIDRRRPVFFEIGIVVTLALVILAFSLSSSNDKPVEVPELSQNVLETELTEIVPENTPPETEPVRASVAVITDILNVVKNDTHIETDFTFVEFDKEIMNLGTVNVEGEEIYEDTPFVSAEQMPSFQGGDLNTFRAWVQKRLVYPEQAKASGIQGKVTLQFVIERDGSLSSIEMLRTPDSSLSEEVIRVLKTSPKWEPGRQRNQPVRIKFTLPIDFVLN